MEKIKFKDVAHYYLGCEIIEPDGTIVTLVNVGIPGSQSQKLTVLQGGMSVRKEWKEGSTPLLRKLDSMTKDEFEILKPNLSIDILNAHVKPVTFRDKPWHVVILENRLQTGTLKWVDGLVLLKAGYDLFNLIENNFALDINNVK